MHPITLTLVSLAVFPFTTGSPVRLTVLVSVLVVVRAGAGRVSVLAETHSSPLRVPIYGECLIPNDFEGEGSKLACREIFAKLLCFLQNVNNNRVVYIYIYNHK